MQIEILEIGTKVKIDWRDNDLHDKRGIVEGIQYDRECRDVLHAVRIEEFQVAILIHSDSLIEVMPEVKGRYEDGDRVLVRGIPGLGGGYHKAMVLEALTPSYFKVVSDDPGYSSEAYNIPLGDILPLVESEEDE